MKGEPNYKQSSMFSLFFEDASASMKRTIHIFILIKNMLECHCYLGEILTKKSSRTRIRNSYLQWGSEIRTSPDLEWSKTGWFADFEWDLKL